MIDINIGDNPLILWAYLGVLALTPMMVALVGYFVTGALKQREHDLNARQRRREICKGLYDDIGPQLNRIYCYVSDLGDFGHHTPLEIIDAKRQADRAFYTYRALWSRPTRDAYVAFMDVAFKTHTGVGVPARIKGQKLQKEAYFNNTGRAWDPAFDAMFTEQRDVAAASAAYDALVEAFVSDLTD